MLTLPHCALTICMKIAINGMPKRKRSNEGKKKDPCLSSLPLGHLLTTRDFVVPHHDRTGIRTELLRLNFPDVLTFLVVEYAAEVHELLTFPSTNLEFWRALLRLIPEQIRATREGSAELHLYSEKDVNSLTPTVSLCIRYRRMFPNLVFSLHPLQNTLEFLSQLKIPSALNLLHEETIFNDRCGPESMYFAHNGWKTELLPWLVEWCERLQLSVALPIVSLLFFPFTDAVAVKKDRLILAHNHPVWVYRVAK